MGGFQSTGIIMSSEIDPDIVGARVQAYLADNGYNLDGYTDRRFKVSVGPLVLNFPNPGKLPYHDLHHVVSGYGTGLVGEAEESVYELRGGCPTTLILFLCLGSIAIGAALSPRRVWRAWREVQGTTTLYASTIPYETLMEMNIYDLRTQLNIPPSGFGTGPNGGTLVELDNQKAQPVRR